jgi:hypothetical protein
MYRLEGDDDGGWSVCNVEEAWVAVLLLLRPGGRRDCVAREPDNAAPGRYRVVKTVQTEEGSVDVEFEFEALGDSPRP